MAAPLCSRVFSMSTPCSHIFKANRHNISVRLVAQRCFHRQNSQTLSTGIHWRGQVFNKHKRSRVSGLIAVRCASTGPDTKVGDIPEGYIPDIPSVPAPEDLISLPELNALGEPTLQSMGLGSNSPSGLFQQSLEFFHVTCDLPWWAAICSVVVILRVALFPVLVKQRKNAIQMGNHMPTVAKLQQQVTQLRAEGNVYEAQLKTIEMSDYMKRNDVNPLRTLLSLAQLPVFLSAFYGIRQMSNLPVESFKTGGMLWFTDLSMCDPFYILPFITGLSMLINIELGIEAQKASHMRHITKWTFRGLTGFIFFITCNFPSGICVYWAANNVFTLCQGIFLRLPAVKSFFDMPMEVKHPEDAIEKKGFVKGFKEAYESSKLQAESKRRRQVESELFTDAARGPIPKTYSYNPKKVKVKA